MLREGREPFPDKAGDSPSCRDQEGRRGRDEVVAGTSVFPSSETGMLGNFWGRIKGAKYRFELHDGTRDDAKAETPVLWLPHAKS